MTETYRLMDIRNNTYVLKSYIGLILKMCRGKTLNDIIKCCHTICPELKEHYNQTFEYFSSKKKMDKGMLGKLCEQLIFGQEPNCKSEPDLLCGVEIKTTHFKSLRNEYGINAKERIKICAVGNKSKYNTLKNIVDNELFTKCKYFKKCFNTLIFVFKKEPGKYDTLEKNMTTKLYHIAFVDYNIFPDEWKTQIQKDYDLIRTQCIMFGKDSNPDHITQTGQKFLHIHPVGSKGSTGKGFGYTPKFTTMIIARDLEQTYGFIDCLKKKGNSIYIDRGVFEKH